MTTPPDSPEFCDNVPYSGYLSDAHFSILHEALNHQPRFTESTTTLNETSYNQCYSTESTTTLNETSYNQCYSTESTTTLNKEYNSTESSVTLNEISRNQHDNIKLVSTNDLKSWGTQSGPAQQVRSICVNYRKDHLHITAEFLRHVSNTFPNVGSLTLVHPDFKQYSKPPENSLGKLITLSIVNVEVVDSRNFLEFIYIFPVLQNLKLNNIVIRPSSGPAIFPESRRIFGGKLTLSGTKTWHENIQEVIPSLACLWGSFTELRLEDCQLCSTELHLMKRVFMECVRTMKKVELQRSEVGISNCNHKEVDNQHCRIDFSQLIYLEEVTIYVADLEHQFDWLGKIYGWRSPCLKKVTFEVEEGPLYTPLTDSTWDKLDGIVSRSWGVWVPRKWTQKAVEITCSWISRVFTGESGPQLLIVRKNPSENITLDLFFNKCCRRGITVKSKNLNSPEMEK